jgi:hypothetical protein
LKGGSCTKTEAKNSGIRFAKISPRQIEIVRGGEFEK